MWGSRWVQVRRVSRFSIQRQSNFILDVGQNVTVNPSLQVAALTQSVEVTGATPLLQAQDASTGQVVCRQFINDIPLTSSSIVDLAFLTPGITEVDPSCPPDYVDQGDSGGYCTVNNFIADGSRGGTADFLIDGVTTSNFEQHGDILMPTYLPSIEAVQEFTLQEFNFSAEYGFTGRGKRVLRRLYAAIGHRKQGTYAGVNPPPITLNRVFPQPI